MSTPVLRCSLFVLLLTCMAPAQTTAGQPLHPLAIAYANDVQGETAPCG